RRILLEVFLVFRPCCRGERAQFTARERRLEEIGGIVLPRRATGPDHGMCFVDEKNDRRRRVLHLFDQSLQAILEFAFDARARLKEREVERAQRDVAEDRGDVAIGDAQGEAFDHGRLADARLADENRIVLSSPEEDVDYLPNLEIATEHLIDLALLGALGE